MCDDYDGDGDDEQNYCNNDYEHDDYYLIWLDLLSIWPNLWINFLNGNRKKIFFQKLNLILVLQIWFYWWYIQQGKSNQCQTLW